MEECCQADYLKGSHREGQLDVPSVTEFQLGKVVGKQQFGSANVCLSQILVYPVTQSSAYLHFASAKLPVSEYTLTCRSSSAEKAKRAMHPLSELYFCYL